MAKRLFATTGREGCKVCGKTIRPYEGEWLKIREIEGYMHDHCQNRLQAVGQPVQDRTDSIMEQAQGINA